MRAAVAFLLTVTMTLAGCFPHDPHKRTIAKVTEGGALVAGIAISAFANTGADCDSMNKPGQDPSSCRSKAQVLSTIGVSLILAGLLGFVATVSTAEDEDKTSATTTTIPDTKSEGSGVGSAATTTTTTTTTNTTNTQATPPPDTGAGSGAGSAAGSGSAAPTPPTPPTP